LEQAKRASGEEATRLFGEAADKYRQALAIKPDQHEALNNWGILLLEQAKRASGEEATRLFSEAEEKLREGLRYEPKSTYDLACLMALRGRLSEARAFLEQAEGYNTLPDASHLSEDSDLESLRRETWFCELLARRSINP
jgi:Tfp pilus assembly protein PilF